MNEAELTELEALPNSLVVLEQAVADVSSELGHPEFQNLNRGKCTYILHLWYVYI